MTSYVFLLPTAAMGQAVQPVNGTLEMMHDDVNGSSADGSNDDQAELLGESNSTVSGGSSAMVNHTAAARSAETAGTNNRAHT